MKFNIEILGPMEKQSLLDVAANGAFKALLQDQIGILGRDALRLNSSSEGFRADYASIVAERETLVDIKRFLEDIYDHHANPQIEE